jgi:hypothetical protein
MDEEQRAGRRGNNSRTVSVRRYVRGDSSPGDAMVLKVLVRGALGRLLGAMLIAAHARLESLHPV